MRRVLLTAEGEVADHLDPRLRRPNAPIDFELPCGLRDLVQAAGVPHVEVARVLVDGREAAWETVLVGSERVRVASRYPLPAPDPDVGFLLDDHLSKLARHLRLIGCDAEHAAGADDAAIVGRAAETGRTVLTRDRGLLMRAALQRGRFVRAVEPVEQAREVIRAFRLRSHARPFSRCLVCNGRLVEAGPTEAGSMVPAGVRRRHDRYRRCSDCDRIYWEGTHHRQLAALANRLLDGPLASRP